MLRQMWAQRRRAGALALLALLAALAVWPAAALAQSVIEGDLRRSTGTATVPADMILRGNLHVTTGRAVVDGRVEGDVNVTTGDVEISGTVTGDVKVITGDVYLGPRSVVEGKVAVVTGQVRRADGARVDGGVNSVSSPGQTRVETPDGTFVIDDNGIRGPGIYIGEDGVRLPGLTIDDSGVRFVDGDSWDDWRWEGMHGFNFFPGFENPLFRILRWAGLFAVGAAALALMPKHLERMAEEIGARPVHVGLVGLLVIFLSPFALLLLVVTIIGIPVIPFAVIAWAVAKFLGWVALSLWLGDLLASSIEPLRGNHGRSFLRLLAGSLVLALAGMVPVLGWLVGMIGAFIGLGVVWVTRFGTGRRTWFGGGGQVGTT